MTLRKRERYFIVRAVLFKEIRLERRTLSLSLSRFLSHC